MDRTLKRYCSKHVSLPWDGDHGSKSRNYGAVLCNKVTARCVGRATDSDLVHVGAGPAPCLPLAMDMITACREK